MTVRRKLPKPAPTSTTNLRISHYGNPITPKQTNVMSVSSNSRKESTESNAAQQMHSTMGIHPDLAQLNDKNLENDLPSRVADSNDIDVPGDVAQVDALIAEADDEHPGSASVRHQSLPADADDASTDEDHPMTAYRQPVDTITESDKVADADWNRSTAEGAIPATRVNEPDRTLGNS